MRKEYGNNVIILDDYAVTINSFTTQHTNIKNDMIDHFLTSQYTVDKLYSDKIYITQNNYVIRSIMREIPLCNDHIRVMNQCTNIVLSPLYADHIENLRSRNRNHDTYVVGMLPIYRGELLKIMKDTIPGYTIIRGTRDSIYKELHQIIGEYIHEKN